MIKHLKNKLIHFGRKYTRGALMVGIFLLCVAIIFPWGRGLVKGLSDRARVASSREITAIKASSNITEQMKLYKQLLERVGPEEAQEDLYKSGLPFNGTTHLINHQSGDYIYDKYGISGLPHCKDYFLSSCYHGFVLDVIADLGMDGVKETFDECYKLGPRVFPQCAHAIGHGFLAYVGYKDLAGALKKCDETQSKANNFPVYNCYDGVFMENIWAVHDDGTPSPDRWVNKDDLLYPCDSKKIDGKYIKACWANQPSLIYLSTGNVEKTATVCLDVKDLDYQKTCFDGLARQIHALAQDNYQNEKSLCNSMPGNQWVDFCEVSNATAGFSVGNRALPFEICAGIRDQDKNFCYTRLFETMVTYTTSAQEFRTLCTKVQDEDWRKTCQSYIH